MVGYSWGHEGKLEGLDNVLHIERETSVDKRDPSLAKALISPKSLLKLSEIEVVSILWETNLEPAPPFQEPSNLVTNQQQQLQSLLDHYGSIF